MPAGRYKKPDNEKKTERFQFMLTPDEVKTRGGRDEVNKQVKEWNDNYKVNK